MGAAGPARPAVHRHGAGAAHADPAGKPIGQRRSEMALHEGHHVEHGLVLAQRHLIALVTALRAAAPYRDLYCFRRHQSAVTPAALMTGGMRATSLWTGFCT